MEGKSQTRNLARDVPEYSSSEFWDGTRVDIRCVEVSGGSKLRYEIYMSAQGFSAVADVSPPEESALLAARIEEIVSAFVDSLKLRAGEAPR